MIVAPHTMIENDIEQLKQCALMVQALSILKWINAIDELAFCPFIKSFKIEVIENLQQYENQMVTRRNARFSIAFDTEKINARFLISWGQSKYECLNFWKKQIINNYISFDENILPTIQKFDNIHQNLWEYVAPWIEKNTSYKSVEFSGYDKNWAEKIFGNEFNDEIKLMLFNEKSGVSYLHNELMSRLKKTQ